VGDLYAWGELPQVKKRLDKTKIISVLIFLV